MLFKMLIKNLLSVRPNWPPSAAHRPSGAAQPKHCAAAGTAVAHCARTFVAQGMESAARGRDGKDIDQTQRQSGESLGGWWVRGERGEGREREKEWVIRRERKGERRGYRQEEREKECVKRVIKRGRERVRRKSER